MKRKLIFLSLIIFQLSFSGVAAQSWVKKSAKSVFTLKTFDANGTLVGNSCGVFVGEQGEAISCYEPFRGASSAVVIDAAGKEYPVEMLLGANDTYDVAKFRVDIKKPQPQVIATVNANEGAAVWLLPYLETKQAVQGIVSKTETFAGTDNVYYTVKATIPQDGAGMPLFNEEGQLLALMQRPMSESDTVSYAVSALFADSLKMTGLSFNDEVYRATGIKKALPTDLAQAQLTLFMAGSTLDSLAYVQLVEDFIRQFPDVQDGYVSRAELATSDDRCADAERDMDQAIKVAAANKDRRDEALGEAHFSYSRLIYQKLIYRPEPAYEPWTFDRALEEAVAAYAASPQPVYRQQQAYVLYSQKKYDEANNIYEELFNTPLRSPDLFIEASRCKLMMADTLGYIALLDSAVAQFSKPYLREAAPYILARAQARLEAGKFRDATNDLNDYEQLMAMQVNASFYYLRFRAEQGGRLFQQALNDIAKAIELNPSQELYYAEKASLEVRVGLYDEAIATAQECIKLVPDYSDGHLFLGLAQCLKGNKPEGVKNLQRAKELGDEQADGLIEKYGK